MSLPLSLPLSRRAFLKGAALFGFSAASLDAFWLEPKRIDVEDVSVWIKDLPRGFNGFKICQITDVHHGPFVGLNYVEEVVKKAKAMEPDMVALTGDYVWGHDRGDRKYIRPGIEMLSKLSGRHGTFAVLGNHDHWVSVYDVTVALRECGISLLRNKHAHIEANGSRICIAGVGDFYEDRSDTIETLKGVKKDVPRIVLSHNPDYAENIPSKQRVDLVIAGHTHGGQVRLPFSTYAPYIPSHYGQKYRGGLVRNASTQIYVSRGIGVVGIPIRVNCPPEITMIRLLSKEDEGSAI